MRRLDVPLQIDLLRSLRPLVASTHDPTIRVRTDRLVRAQRTPEGPATLDVTRLAPRRFEVEAYGPGAGWALEHAPGLLGAHDDLAGFDPTIDRIVARAARIRPDLRLVRTGLIEDVLVPTILAQRVTTREAARSWTRIVRAWGDPAPGPYGLRLAPAPERLATIPYWAFHRLGVERSRAVRIAQACRRIEHLQAGLGLPYEAALEHLTRVPGVGVWTAALLLRVAGGEPDAVEVGDYSVKDHVAWNLAGEPRATDDRMLELLQPFSGHRGRVVRLLLSAGRRPPTFGPKPRVVPVDHL